MRRRRSPKLEAYLDELERVRPSVVSHYRGQCHICGERGTVVHHRKLRSQGGTNDLANLLLLCESCHAYVHNHPALAVSAGYILRQSDPEVPLSKGEIHGDPSLAV